MLAKLLSIAIASFFALLGCEFLLALLPGLQPLGVEKRIYCAGPEYKDSPGSIFYETQHEAEGWKLHVNNADGFRDVFDVGNVGMIVLGDSFTRGEVVNNGEHYTDLVDVWMPTVGVRAFGVGGWGTGDALMQYRKVAETPHERVVLGYFVGNDLTDNLKAGFRLDDGALVFPPEGASGPRPKSTPRSFGLRIRSFVQDNVRVYRLARHAYFLLVENNAQRAALTAGQDELLAIAERLLEYLREDVERRNARLLIVAIPSYNEFIGNAGSPAIEAQYALLSRLAAAHESVDWIDLRAAVAEQPLRKVYAADGHMARFGQYLVAEAIAQAVGVTAPPYREDGDMRITPNCKRATSYAKQLGAYGPQQR